MKAETDPRLDAPNAAVRRNEPVTHAEPETAHPVAAGGSHEGMHSATDSANEVEKSSGRRQGKPMQKKTAKEPEFKGYTLEELRMRKVINELKIDIAKERIRTVVSPRSNGETDTIKSCVRGFDSIMRYVDIALLAFGISRRLFGFMRRFSRRR